MHKSDRPFGAIAFVSRLIRKQRVFVLKIFIVGWFSDNR